LIDPESSDLINDLSFIRKCYLAREMVENGIITYDNYEKIIMIFEEHKLMSGDLDLINKFADYEKVYLEDNKAIDEYKIISTIKAYSNGTTYQYFDEIGVESSIDPSLKASYILRGIGASLGWGKGHAEFFKEQLRKWEIKHNEFILVIDSEVFSTEHIDLIWDSQATITWNCGKIGHIPVICRGMGKPCVILNENDIKRIKEESIIEVCGTDGIVLTGVLTER
jgi:phosphoenolpyruvate synthase/pyruvate phosphate dikinase